MIKKTYQFRKKINKNKFKNYNLNLNNLYNLKNN